MLIDKEYPATHSMSTSWYIVDEEGNAVLDKVKVYVLIYLPNHFSGFNFAVSLRSWK